MCSFIRTCIQNQYDEKTASRLPVLYGGSVKPDNIGDIMSRQDVDGVLVGGASLDPQDFAKIVRSGRDA
jgi:triosephosphate isomerase